ncbi:MAG: sulfatase-like hydrolase/transferase [Bacteroidia bacterium]|nr:sulfatase-like hydrolase/transferase [Bacteroidia bacterium]
MNVINYSTVLFAGFFLSGSGINQAQTIKNKKPNIILMMADDMGWGDVGFNGNTIIKTPNLDEMARASMRFERFYSPGPVSSPSRGGCLTGRHPYRYGIWSANEGHMRKEEITIAEALKTQGYTTGHFGKWHLGTLNPQMGPTNKAGRNPERNFTTPGMNGSDEWFATETCVRTWDPMIDNTLNPYWHNGVIETENLSGDDSRILMDRAIPFIRKAADEETPFLAVIWFHAPHGPVVAGPEFREMYKDYDEGQQHYYGCITALDVQVGRLRKELKDIGVAENTIIWFASDNGPEGNTGDEGTSRGSAGPFRGRKRSLWEGGIHVPGLVEWPAQIKPGISTAIPCSGLDYFPTILDILGFKMQGQPDPIDGVSLLPLIKDNMKERPVPIPFETLGGTGSNSSRGSARMALVDNRFKLLTDMAGPDDKDLLFDLVADQGETTDISAQNPEIVKSMKETLLDFRESCKKSLSGENYNVPFTPDQDDIHPSVASFPSTKNNGNDEGNEEVGKSKTVKTDKTAKPNKKKDASGMVTPAATGAADEKKAQSSVDFQNDDSGIVSLLASTAALHGNLSYIPDQEKIGRWSNEGDWVSWDFEVRQPFTFDVEVSSGQIEDGSVYEISVGDQKLTAVVSASGDFKKPKVQTVGSINLTNPGQYTLSLKPVSKKGQVVMTLWKVDLIPVLK